MGLGEKILGKNETVQKDSNASKFTTFGQGDANSLEYQKQALEQTGNEGGQQLYNLNNRIQNYQSPQLNSNFGQYQANLNTNFQGPQFSQGLDTTSQNLLSQELGNRQAQLQRQQQGIQQQFGGRNNQLSQILQSQAGAQAQLANNPLAFQLGQQQMGREAQQYQLGQQAQQLGNQALLSQQGFNAGLQGQGNQTLGQQFGLDQSLFQGQIGAIGAQNNYQANLLNQLAQLAQLRGAQNSVSQESQTSNQRGLADALMARMNPFSRENTFNKVVSGNASQVGQAGAGVPVTGRS